MKSPAFQFYPSDWLASRAIRLEMNAEQRGWYIQLLCEAWESDPQGSLPNDPKLLWKLAGATDEVHFNSTSQSVLSQFEVKNNLLWNNRLVEERAKQIHHAENSRKGGLKSGEIRKNRLKDIKNELLTKTKCTSNSPRSEMNSSSSSSSLSSNTKKTFNFEELKFPEKLKDGEFKELFKRWTLFRQKKKRVIDPSIFFQDQLNELAIWGREKAVDAISTSLKQQWQGLFEPDSFNKPIPKINPRRNSNPYPEMEVSNVNAGATTS